MDLLKWSFEEAVISKKKRKKKVMQKMINFLLHVCITLYLPKQNHGDFRLAFPANDLSRASLVSR